MATTVVVAVFARPRRSAERDEIGADAFRDEYGTNDNGRNAFGQCVSEHVNGDDGAGDDGSADDGAGDDGAVGDAV